MDVTTIYAAQANDMSAVAELLAASESTITRLANKAAMRTGNYSTHAEDFAQVGRVAMWEALARFNGANETEWFGYLIRTVETSIADAARIARSGGAGIDKDAVWVYGQMLAQAEGDPYKAAKLAQTEPKAGDRLSADRADAARLAYHGTVSLDAPSGDDEGTLADTLLSEDETPDVVRPKVGTGAALEALAVLQRYSAAYQVLNALPGAAEDVDAIEDAVILPRDPQQRRWVLDAVAILRSYVSTAKDGDLAEDLREIEDERRDERAVKTAQVREAVASIAGLRGDVLRHSFGLEGATCFGYGNDGDTAGLAEFLGKTQVQVTDSRRKAYASFAKNYASMQTPERCAELLDAFAATRRVRKVA